MDYRIKVSDDALETMALAAVEAYCLGDGRKKVKIGLETAGFIWGFKKKTENEIFYYVTKLGVSISSVRDTESVASNPDSGPLMEQLVQRTSPQLTMLGDFHTHPYDDLEQVQTNKGFEFSDADFEYFDGEDFMWRASSNEPLMLVMTICRLKRVRDNWGRQLRFNTCEFSIGEFRFWLTATVGYLGSDEQRVCLNSKRSSVFLDLHSRFFNLGSDRISSQ